MAIYATFNKAVAVHYISFSATTVECTTAMTTTAKMIWAVCVVDLYPSTCYHRNKAQQLNILFFFLLLPTFVDF